MGHEADIFVIYGVRLGTNIKKLEKVFETMRGEALEYKEEMSQIETFIPNTGYTILNFDDEEDIFVACYYKIHNTTNYTDDCLEIKLPSHGKRKEFKKWLVENGIDEKCKLYTKLCQI